MTITEVPTLPGTEFFGRPTESAYDRDTGFAPDARRIIDLAELQVALEKHRAANGSYPPALSALFPKYAPMTKGVPRPSAPVDPVTGEQYRYQTDGGGKDYTLSATMDNESRYIVHRPGS